LLVRLKAVKVSVNKNFEQVLEHNFLAFSFAIFEHFVLGGFQQVLRHRVQLFFACFFQLFVGW
jgi:hypothetical protein